MSVRIRPAGVADVELIVGLIRELAAYERASEKAQATAAQIEHWLFGADRAAEALIASLDGVPAGLALFYRTFSTWEGTPGLYLEDLFVREEHRRRGVGEALLTELARVTVQRGYTRLEWAALDWNAPALAFYAALGAEVHDEWKLLRLDGERLAALGDRGQPPTA